MPYPTNPLDSHDPLEGISSREIVPYIINWINNHPHSGGGPGRGVGWQDMTHSIYTLGARALASGRMDATGIWLPAGVTVSSLGFNVAAAGSLATLFRFGLYRASDLALVASTANDPTLQATLGPASRPLTTAFAVPASALYYIAVLEVTAGVLTTPHGEVILATASRALGASPRPFFAQTGLADLPNPAVPTDSDSALWFGWH